MRQSAIVRWSMGIYAPVALAAASILTAAPPINQDAKAIARAFPNSPLEGGNIEKAVAQMRKVLSELAKTNRQSRSSLRAVMTKAFDFRDDIGPNQQLATMNAVLNAWETAYAYGAFDEEKRYTGHGTKGRYQGQELIFENIVPREVAPEFAGYIGNLRIVPVALARKKGDAPTSRELGYLEELRDLRKEYLTKQKLLAYENRKPIPKLALSAEEAEKRYQKEVEKAGELIHREPSLRILGQKMSSPSKMSRNRYQVRFEVTNISRHPTEVELECRIVGYTDNENLLYEMKSIKKTLKLRSSQVESFSLWTDNVKRFIGPLKKYDPEKSTKVYYRGYTIIARFKGKVIAAKGSDGRLQRIVSGEKPTPIPKI